MTRKTQFLLAAAAAMVSVAAFTAFWLTRGDEPAPDDTQAHTTPADTPKDGPPDPRALGEVRKAYQEKLAEDAPPGMIELMQGSEKGRAKPGELPPLPPAHEDPFVVPAGHQSGGSSGDLPPLPPLPPTDRAPSAKKPASQEAPPPGLPPLPPLPEVKPEKP